MAMVKVGTDSYNGKETPVYLVCGNATRDAESKMAGDKKLSTVGIAAAKKKNGETVYININGWRGLYREVLCVKKGDSILAVGRLKDREYNGKTYYDLDADFVCKSGAGLVGAVSASASAAGETGQEDAHGDDDGFAEIEEGDGELPF